MKPMTSLGILKWLQSTLSTLKVYATAACMSVEAVSADPSAFSSFPVRLWAQKG